MSDLQCPATILVARHGDAPYVETWFSDEGGWLTAAGRQQATTLAQALAGRRISRVWTSDVSRAVQQVGVGMPRAARQLLPEWLLPGVGLSHGSAPGFPAAAASTPSGLVTAVASCSPHCKRAVRRPGVL